MGKKEEKGTRAAEADKSPRKAPRLEPQDSARGGAAEPERTPSPELIDPERPSTPSPVRSGSMEVAVGSDSDTSSEPCRHFFATEEETELLLAKVESLKYGPDPACEYCLLLDSYGIGPGQVNPHKQQLFMLCTKCEQCSCGVVNSEDQPQGHVRMHALEHEHWVALWLDKLRTGYCFLCDIEVYLHATGTESDEVSSFNDGSMSSEGDLAHASGPNTDEGGYVIRGIPNVANTCYMNALVQCLLVLDKLRTGMLGPNAPKGSIGTALKELFVETSASNDARMRLNPWNLLKSIRALDPKYNGSAMHDSHELLCSLREWLNDEELKRPPNMQDCTSAAVITTVVGSIFQGELSTTRTNNCCQYETVRKAPFHELSLPLASEKHPSKGIASPRRTHRSQQKSPVVKQLFPVVEESNSEKVQITADGGDSGIPHTEVESVAMEKSPEPMEVDYSESMQIHQRKIAVHGPLLTHKDVVSFPELPEEIIEVPVKSVALLPDSVFSVKVEEMHEPTADSNSPEDTVPPTLVSPVRRKNASVASSSDVEQTDNADGAYQSNKPEADREGKKNTSFIQIIREAYIVKENTCMVQVTKEDKGKASSCNFAYDEKSEGSNFLATIKDCLELFLKEEVIERRCEKCSKVPQQPSTTGSTHGNTSVDNVLIEQQYEREHADQNVTISKLPPVLTVQLLRFGKDKDDSSKQVKIKGHVSFEENLDVRQFMEPSSEDKDNSCYRLVGIIEHIGDSLNSGHFVAYVRVSRVGSNKQLSSGPSSWFCADDNDIQQVSLEEVLKREAFILFYERMEG